MRFDKKLFWIGVLVGIPFSILFIAISQLIYAWLTPGPYVFEWKRVLLDAICILPVFCVGIGGAMMNYPRFPYD